MKRRTKELAALGLAAMMLFAGCGTKDTAGTTPQAENPVQTTTNETDSQAEVETESETEETETVTVTIVGEQHEAFSYLNENHIAFMENGLVGVMDMEGNVVKEPMWAYCIADLQDGYFALGKTTDDGKEENHLYDSSGQEIFTTVDYPEYYISSMNENVLVLRSLTDESCVFLDVENGFTPIAKFEETPSDFEGASEFINGCAVITSYTVLEHGTTKLPNYIDKTGEKKAFFDGFTTLAYPVDDDGWVLGFPTDETGHYTGERWLRNVNTGQIVDVTGKIDISRVWNEEHTAHFLTRGGFACLSDTSKETQTWKIMNLETGEFVKDTEYGYVGLDFMHEGLMLYANADYTEYGYLDTDFNEVGSTYEDATEFRGDYAMIHQDGGQYIINKDLEIVSEKLDGDNAVAIGEGVFRVTAGDKLYVVKVEE